MCVVAQSIKPKSLNAYILVQDARIVRHPLPKQNCIHLRCINVAVIEYRHVVCICVCFSQKPFLKMDVVHVEIIHNKNAVNGVSAYKAAHSLPIMVVVVISFGSSIAMSCIRIYTYIALACGVWWIGGEHQPGHLVATVTTIYVHGI